MITYIVYIMSNFNPYISDCDAIIFNLHLNKPPHVTKTIKFHSLARITTDAFNKDLANCDPTCSLHDLLLLVTAYDVELSQLHATHAPSRTKTIVDQTDCNGS